MRHHEWIKIEITPVHVLSNEEETPVVFVDPDDAIEAEENAQYGCSRCDISLDADTLETPCCPDEEEPRIEYEGQVLDMVILDDYQPPE